MRKSAARARRAAAKKPKTTRKRKLNAYARFLKKVGGKGHSRADIKRMWARMKKGAKPMPKKRKTTKRKSRSRSRASTRRVASRKTVGSQLKAAERRAKNKANLAKARAAKARKARMSKARRLRAQGYTPRQILGMKRSGSPVYASANGLALENAGIMQALDPRNIITNFRAFAVPMVSGFGVGAAAHGVLAGTGVQARICDTLAGLPIVGVAFDTPIPVLDRTFCELAPHTIQGSVAGIALGALAAVSATVLPGQRGLAAFLASTSASAVALGPVLDIYFFSKEVAEERLPSVGPMGALALDNFGGIALDNFGGLALDNFGGIALDNTSALGGIALDNTSALGGLALSNYGDGFAYQTAPLQASSVGDYEQCSMGDAFYSGSDFSVEEGTALMNGRDSWFQHFGTPAYRPKSDPSAASHFAGQPGHRWGWLVRFCGWPKAQQIAALPPKKRLQVIKEMRAAAMAAYQRSMLTERAVAAEAQAPAPEFAPAGGAQAPGGPVGAYGDPILFMA
jgi:hypothetical protein